MTTYGCPHCKNALPAAPPGRVRCTSCQGYATIPGPADVARMEKKRSDEKTVLLVIGAVAFVVYVAPMLLAIGYMCFVGVIWLLMMVVALVGAA